MKCPSCSKFAALEVQDPEEQRIDVSSEGIVEGTVRLVRTSACCNDEMKEAIFEIEEDFSEDIAEHRKTCQHELSVELADLRPSEEGGSRYKKSYFGAEGEIIVTCGCGSDGASWSREWSDKIQASAMDELV